MVFLGVEEQEFRIDIVNLEFPQSPKIDKDDDVFLMIRIEIKSNFGCFDDFGAFLTVSEIEYLINWLRNLSKNKPNENKWFYTIEDYFELELLNSNKEPNKKIKIHFHKPQKYFIETNINNHELLKYANQLKHELKMLYKEFSARKHLYKLLIKEIKAEKNGILIEKDFSIYKKNNFVDRYDKREGYKIVFSKAFINDLNHAKKMENFETIQQNIDTLKKYPCNTSVILWDNFFSENGIIFKIIGEYIIFYKFIMYDKVYFLRLLYNKKEYQKYLEYLVNRYS
jgi:hypothetical protein